MLDTLMSGELSFPYYTWTLSRSQDCTITNSLDCSYSGSRIDKTYFTFVNRNSDSTSDTDFEIFAANH